MKKIICELCECMEFTKEGGMFVCNSCGTKYTAEEARGMMREVEGAAPAIIGGTPTSFSVGNPNQQQIDNLLLLATNAYSANNNEETEKCCNKVIEYDAMCYKAWFLKAKAVGWSSTIQNPRIAEAAYSFKQAIDFAPEKEREILREEAVDELKRLGLACISLRQKRFSQYPDNEELTGFVTDVDPLINGMAVLLDKGADVGILNTLDGALGDLRKKPSIAAITLKSKGETAGVPKEFFTQFAVMMNNAAVNGFETVVDRYSKDSRPYPKDFQKALTEADNCADLLLAAIRLNDDDDEEDVTRYENLIAIHKFTIEMTAYADYDSYSRSWMLTDEAKKARRKMISEYKKEISKIKEKQKEAEEAKRKAEEDAKKERIKAYWDAHVDEKSKLDAEKKELTEKKDKLNAEIADLTKQINAVQPTGTVPSEEERNAVSEQIKELRTRKDGLGIFAGKEKKRIDEEIAALQSKVDSLNSKINEERRDRATEADKKVAPLKEKKAELEKERNTAIARISAIDTELTKDR